MSGCDCVSDRTRSFLCPAASCHSAHRTAVPALLPSAPNTASHHTCPASPAAPPPAASRRSTKLRAKHKLPKIQSTRTAASSLSIPTNSATACCQCPYSDLPAGAPPSAVVRGPSCQRNTSCLRFPLQARLPLKCRPVPLIAGFDRVKAGVHFDQGGRAAELRRRLFPRFVPPILPNALLLLLAYPHRFC